MKLRFSRPNTPAVVTSAAKCLEHARALTATPALGATLAMIGFRCSREGGRCGGLSEEHASS